MEETSKYRTTKTVSKENGEKRGRGRTETTKKPAPEMVCRDKGEDGKWWGETETTKKQTPEMVCRDKGEDGRWWGETETTKNQTPEMVCRDKGEDGRWWGETETSREWTAEVVCRDKGEKQRDTETGNRNVPWAVAQTKREYVFSWVSINFHSAS